MSIGVEIYKYFIGTLQYCGMIFELLRERKGHACGSVSLISSSKSWVFLTYALAQTF